MDRHDDLTLRLTSLIEVLAEENPDVELPDEEAAEVWTEAEIRAYFRSAGMNVPQKMVLGQPGGGREQGRTREVPEVPQAMLQGRAFLTVALYRKTAFFHGIPLRRLGLFPNGDAVLKAVTAEGFTSFFVKHLVGADGALQLATECWPLGEGALRHGIDLRYAFRPDEKHGRLAAAVRFSEAASIGSGFMMSTHGGAIETVFDETTAELAKISVAPLATTIEFACTLKKAVPTNSSCRLDAWITELTSNGLRIHTEATLKDERGVLLATCKAVLCDIQKLQMGPGR